MKYLVPMKILKGELGANPENKSGIIRIIKEQEIYLENILIFICSYEKIICDKTNGINGNNANK